ncbi:polysaccharide deacetylase family protein [Patescibacteria group bacterium]
MKWINLLHLYQPAHTDAHIIVEATEKSYKRLVRALQENPKIKFTFNITGCLFKRWEILGYHQLIQDVDSLIKKGQLELTGSAAYHPILPLVPKEEVKTQILENEDILKSHFGDNFKPKGFFLPELAYSTEVGKIISSLGYTWIVLDEIAYCGKLNQVNYKKLYQDKVSGLKIIFRNRKHSKSYVPDTMHKIINSSKNSSNGIVIVTATDAELYGLRHEDFSGEFEKLLQVNNFSSQTISEYISGFEETEKIRPISSNWESTEKDLVEKKPFALWFEKENPIQQKLWELAKLAINTIENSKKDDSYYWARWHLVRGLSSCSFWWASAKDFRLFGPISWNPDEIERGVNELIRSIRALDDITTRQTKMKAEKLYIKIKQMVWEKHWTYYWKK